MTTIRTAPTAPGVGIGLHRLSDLELVPEFQVVLEELHASLLGSPPWVARKLVELRELLALAQIAPGRITILGLDAATEIRVWMALRCEVACLRPGDVDVTVEHEAHLAIRYPEELLRMPLPGTSLVDIIRPANVFHPNVLSIDAPQPVAGVVIGQRLCLGVRIPRRLPLREIVLMSHAALTLQSVQVDEHDAAGVLNASAARFWQQRPERMPLSRVPFLGKVAS